MPQQPEPGNVRSRVHAHAGHRRRPGPVQCRHRRHCPGHYLRIHHPLLAGGGDNPRADGLAQYQGVARLRPGVADLLPGRHHADDRQPVFGLRVVHRMPAHNEALRFGGLGVPALQDAPQNALVQAGGKAHHIQRPQRPPAHCVHIRQRIGGRNGPEFVRIVGDRRKEIHRGDQRRVLIDLIHGGVIPRLGPHQQVGVPQQGNIAQNLAQVLKRQLGRSTRAVRQLGQPDGGLDFRCATHSTIPCHRFCSSNIGGRKTINPLSSRLSRSPHRASQSA